MVAHSATLAINERLQAKRAAGERVVHLGFGEAGLPVPPHLADVLAAASPLNAYGPVVGTSQVRRAAAGYFGRRGLPTGEDQIIVAPGSKALLYALITALPGDVVLPQPSWVTYAAQAALAGKHVIGVPVPPEAGGVPDPDELDRELREARATGHQPGILVVTLPDNPTGTLASEDLVKRVCAVAAEHDLAIISDEIYRDLTYRSRVCSPATVLPDRCFVTSGLSKSMALGGWRIGFSRFPDGALGRRVQRDVVGIASEIWSSLAAPMQEVAAHVLDESAETTAHIAASRALHEHVAKATHERFTAAGIPCREPQAAFYLYPDFEPLRPVLAERGVGDADGLAEYLLDQHGIGVLSGAAFGDDPAGLRFRAATSLLYGSTDEQRWTALRSDDPTALPWIADTLTQLGNALDAIRKP
ncbi:pyridoxal phosphate-dependent aminotransferase [Saccharopolyspora sp. K220]|uniref:pyridoxal phosphate-dependent aminotransferase n=1 Tax=Saccharopolyspora soli TaxID=2926618 RepID=UPI001F598D27|nr:pyridoxal phosphate-dependent aminotransferase [Saccharopolyspora soli]MCI2416677.1 pyridoxal phosphate-dependent aminotransferase [Saccharopolyspora soli]